MLSTVVDNLKLSGKNIQAFRALFSIANRNSDLLGSAWFLIVDAFNALDYILNHMKASKSEIPEN